MHTLASLNPIAILVVAVISFLLGGLWYSPVLFVYPWMKEMKITPESRKADYKGPLKTFGPALFLTLVSTATLATLISLCHIAGPLKGAEFGLFAAIGLVAAREGTNAVFENRSFKLFAIVAGYDVVLFASQGSILAVWR
jgi:hypothetical protein